MKIDSLIVRIITASNIDHFSVVEVRTAYLALKNDSSIDPSETRRFVYAELSRLVNKGWLKKLVSKKKGVTSYVKTERFDPLKFQVVITAPIEKMATENEKLEGALATNLLGKLHDYKNELLIGLGEAEEYKQLCTQLPQLHSSLQLKYNCARERNAKLLGKIKAVEVLIKATGIDITK